MLGGPLGWLGAKGVDRAVENNHGPAPQGKEFGGNQYKVDTEGHSDYWKPNSESVTNQARVIVGHYGDVSLEHGEKPVQDWVA